MRTFVAIEIPATLHGLIHQQQQTLEAILVQLGVDTTVVNKARYSCTSW